MHEQTPKKQQEYSDLHSLQKALYQLLEQIAKRDQKILWINSEKMAALRSYQEKEQALLQKLAEKDAVLQYTQTQLTDREAQLHEILSSRTWKMALFLQRVRVFFVPPQGRLAQTLQRGIDMLKKTGRN
jgi:hypothetical protein